MASICKLRFGKELSELKIQDIQLLIDNKIDESINLDYKQSSDDPQKDCDNLAEVISSFLNTDGGIIGFGIAESRDKDNHRYPSSITWTKTTKERIENLLVSRVQPWSEKVVIQRIPNEKEQSEGIFVIEVPKSNHPPHMSNNVYYQRFNFQNKPMSHEMVYQAFQNTWIRNKDIVNQIVEPLYSEIRSLMEQLECYKIVDLSPDAKFCDILSNNRFLYDLLSENARGFIEEFYDRVSKLQLLINGRAYKIAINIVYQELCQSFPNEVYLISPSGDNFEITVCLKDETGLQQTSCGFKIYDLLFTKETLDNFLVEKYPNETIVSLAVSMWAINSNLVALRMSDKNLRAFWKRCEDRAKKDNRLIEIWKEADDLWEMGNGLLTELTST